MKKLLFNLFLLISLLIIKSNTNAQTDNNFGKLSVVGTIGSLADLKIKQTPQATTYLSLDNWFQSRTVVLYDKNNQVLYASRGGLHQSSIQTYVDFSYSNLYSAVIYSRSLFNCSVLNDINDLKGGRIEVIISTTDAKSQAMMNLNSTELDNYVVSSGTTKPNIVIKNKATGAVVVNWTSPALTFAKSSDGYVIASGPITF